MFLWPALQSILVMERASHSTASHRSVISIHFFFLSSSFSYNALPFNLLFKVSLTDTVLHQKLWSCFSFRLNHFYQSAIGKSELKRRKKKKKKCCQLSDHFRAPSVCLRFVRLLCFQLSVHCHTQPEPGLNPPGCPQDSLSLQSPVVHPAWKII